MEDPNTNDPPARPELQKMSFLKAFSFEGSLVIVALILAWIFNVPLLADFHWSWQASLLGVTSTLPLLAFFAWILQSEYPPFVEVRGFLDQFVQPLFGSWSVSRLALLSIMAGVGEEILFRGVLQAGITNTSTPLLGAIVASLAFAICHALTKAYFISTFVIGLYLSLVWHVADNLLAPILTHAIYDFVALLYFLKWYPRQASKSVHEKAGR